MNEQAEQLPMTPAERRLLKEMQELADAAQRIAAGVAKNQKALQERDNEIATLRRAMIELKEENQHLREVLQTWRERLDAVLSQLKGIS